LLEARLGSLGVPMVRGVPIGHGQRNIAVPLGVRARLDANAGQLSVEPAR
jgi:muramoyltetrapeptide carboxypeptidase